MKLSEKLEYEDLTLEERLYEVEAAITEEYREVHKQAIADWIASLETQNTTLLEALEKLGRLAINAGKAPSHEDALNILLDLGNLALEAVLKAKSHADTLKGE